jgi:hypothetical protein
MADVEVVRLALQSAYTLVHDPGSGIRGTAPGLVAPLLASRLTIALASDCALSVARAGFGRGDLTWVQHLPLEPPDPQKGLVPLAPALPESWLDSNWPAVVAALTRDVVLIHLSPTANSQPMRGVAVLPLVSDASVPGTSSGVLRGIRTRQRGDLRWAVAVATGLEANDLDGAEDSGSAPPRSHGRRQDIPWWDLGAWHFTGRTPRL